MLEPEAPFGESNGYVALEAFNMPIEVTAITHKKKPVFAQIISQVTPSESSVIKKVAYEPLFLAHLKTQLGVKGIRRVVMHERLTNLRPVIFLQFAAGTPRTEVWRGLNGASTLQSNCGKIVIAVSEDIDPSSMDAVLWSLAYRTNPVDDMHIVPQPRRRAGRAIRRQQDRLRPAGRRDAQARRCRRSRLPTQAIHGARARACGRSSACRALNVQAPWHGYTLDDWTDTWETFARRTTAGDWEETGRETLKRQRRGLLPETPVRPGQATRTRRRRMARVPYLEQSDLPPEHQDILARPIALNRAMANSPNAVEGDERARHVHPPQQQARSAAARAGDPPGRLSRQSPYEYSHHVKLGRESGVTDDDIRAIGEETAGRPSKLDPLSKTVLRAAREMTSDLAMSDETFATLEKALGREQVIDLTLAIAFYNAVVRLLGTLQIDVEPEYQKYLEEHPLPR